MELDLEKALSIIDQGLSHLKCTRQEHELLLKALEVVKKSVLSSQSKPPEPSPQASPGE